MAGPNPQNTYQGFNASPSGIPETESPAGRGPRLNVRATPEDMGAQVGSALSGLGKAGQQAGNEAADLAIKYQGMINETLATNTETKYMEALGNHAVDFRSKEGLAAVNALPDYLKTVSGLREQMGKDLPGGAQRAFNSLAQRHEAYAINDANLYTAQQIKHADTQSATSQIQMSITNAGSLPVAMDDKRFNGVLQDIHFGQGRQMQTQGWDSGTGMNQNPEDGSHSFDTGSEQGKNAQYVYDELTNKNVSAAWESRLKAIAENVNVGDAYKKYKESYDQIPPEGRVKLDQYFAPKVRDFDSKNVAESVLGRTSSDYQNQVYGGHTNPNNIGNVKTQSGAVGGFAQFQQPATPEDGVIMAASNLRSNYRGLTLQQIGDKWAPPSENSTSDWVKNVSNATGMAPDHVPNLDNPAELKALVSGIGAAEKKPEDLGRFTPEAMESGIQKAISGSQANTTQPTASGRSIPSVSDYYKQNYSDILSKARDEAEKHFPGDIDFAEKTEMKTKQRMDAIIDQQKKYDDANRDSLLKAVNGEMSNGQKPQTIEQLTAISPQIKDAWSRIQVDNPEAANRIETHMVGAKQDGKLGEGFSYLQQQAYQGKLNVDDMLYHVGNDLTQEGFNKLKSIVKPEISSEEKSENDQMATFLKYGHDRIVHSSLFHNTPEAEEAYQGWSNAVTKQIQQKKKDGAPLSILLDPQSKDYIGGNVSQFMVPVQKQLNDRADRINQRLQTAQPISQDKLRVAGETPEQYLTRVNAK